MAKAALVGKRQMSYRVDEVTKFQIESYARRQKLDSQAVVARAVNFAHPKLYVENAPIGTKAGLRGKQDVRVDMMGITPILTEHTIQQIEDIRLARNMARAEVVRESLRMFFLEEEQKISGTFDASAFAHYCAPTYPLSLERFIAPWIEKAPTICAIGEDRDVLPGQLEGKKVYVGADFFLTMMTCLEQKNGPRSRQTRSSEDILRLASGGKISLVTSAGELNNFIGVGAALVEALDQTQLNALVYSFKTEGKLASNGAMKLAGRMAYLSKLGIRVVPSGLDDYAGAINFKHTGADSTNSFTTLLGLSTMSGIAPGEPPVMLRFLSKRDHPLMLVWQVFSEGGYLEQMSSRDV